MTERVPDPPAPDPPSPPQRIRLVVCDMDGTLLDGDGRIPAAFWPLLERMQAAGIAFVPASGRQLATLERLFARVEGLSFVAENGAIVTHGGEVIATTFCGADAVHEIVRRVRATDGALGLVVSGPQVASIEQRDDAFVAEAKRYHVSLEQVDDLDTRADAALKLAIYAEGGTAEAADRWLRDLPAGHRLVISSHRWMDVIRDTVDKRLGVEALQRELGMGAAETMVFGDYRNDLGMLEAATWSYAMADGHPDVLAAARFTAPPNREQGVLRVLERMLGG